MSTVTALPPGAGRAASKTLLLLSLRSPMLCRHILNDLQRLLPGRAERDSKFKSAFNIGELLELADLKDCDSVFLIETRKSDDYPSVWILTRGEDKGETVLKFTLSGIFTIYELKFLGNPLADAPMLALFSPEFGSTDGWRRVRATLLRIFHTAGDSADADKAASFFVVDGSIFVRFYHIVHDRADGAADGEKGLRLEEVGPRLVLTPRESDVA